MQFAHPKFLWFLLVLLPLIAWYIAKQRNARPAMHVSTIAPVARLGRSWRQYVRHLLFVLRLGAIACLIVILARPQLKDSWNTSSTEGTDIVIALDVSSSMLAKDLTPNRLERAKEVARNFIDARPNDKIGIVLFAGEALTGLPMTTDREALKSYLKSVDINMLEDGTAIGDGLATAVNRLRADTATVGKSIILLTDGSNNTGITTPLDGADAAKEFGIKIYSIGIGTNGTAMFPDHYDYAGRIVYAPHKVVIEEEPLRQMAARTGGKYFRATGDDDLSEIFNEIDALETTRVDIRQYSHTEDNYMFWAWLCFGLVCLELLLRYTAARSIP